MATARQPAPPAAQAPPPQYADWYNQMVALNREAQAGRIPDGQALETASSASIAGLLSPGNFFPDTNRQAAEIGAARGIPLSPASWSTAVRMNDEERLRRMALGQEFLSAATARNPVPELPDPSSFIMSPYQQALIKLQEAELQLQRKAQRAALAKPPTRVTTGMPNLAAGVAGHPNLGAPGSYPIYTGGTAGTRQDTSWLTNPALDTFQTGLGGTFSGPVGGSTPPAGTTVGQNQYWNWPGAGFGG